MHENASDFSCVIANGNGQGARSFDTVRDYDEAEYRYHERASRSDSQRNGDRRYRGGLLLTEVGLSVEGRRRDVLMSMAAGYIYLRLCDSSSDLLKRLIPYRYRRGSFHGRREGQFERWDMRLDANGQEWLVEELERRIWAYEEERFESLLTQWDVRLHCCVYFVQEPGCPESRHHVIFSDKSALSRVRFRSFLGDCRQIERPAHTLHKAVLEEKDLLARFITAEHAKLLAADPPEVVRLPTRYRLLRCATPRY